jgi:hypothetical protein
MSQPTISRDIDFVLAGRLLGSTSSTDKLSKKHKRLSISRNEGYKKLWEIVDDHRVAINKRIKVMKIMLNWLKQESSNFDLSTIIYNIIVMQEELSLKEIWFKNREKEIIETQFAKLPKERQMEILTRRTFDKPFEDFRTRGPSKIFDPLYEMMKGGKDER